METFKIVEISWNGHSDYGFFGHITMEDAMMQANDAARPAAVDLDSKEGTATISTHDWWSDFEPGVWLDGKKV